jgi:hypothetical protein
VAEEEVEMIKIEWTNTRSCIPDPNIEVLGYYIGKGIKISHIDDNGDWHDGEPDYWISMPSPPRFTKLGPGEHDIKLYRIEKN